jgi:hypothetical protein
LFKVDNDERQRKRRQIVRTVSNVHNHSIGEGSTKSTEVQTGSQNGAMSEAGAYEKADDETGPVRAGSKRVAMMPDLDSILFYIALRCSMLFFITLCYPKLLYYSMLLLVVL